MTYDFRVPGAEPLAGHHANLYTHPRDPNQLSADRAVRDFLAAGVPSEKLILGVPFYGRAWGEVRAKNDGLYQPGRPPAERLDTSHTALAVLGGREGWVRVWDDLGQAPFLWHADRGSSSAMRTPNRCGSSAATSASTGWRA